MLKFVDIQLQEAQDKEILVVIDAGEVEELIEQMGLDTLSSGAPPLTPMVKLPPYPLAGAQPTPYSIFPVRSIIIVFPNPPPPHPPISRPATGLVAI